MNDTPAGDRTVIGFFGRRNVGKSSVVNAVTGQQLAVVSEVGGTTTDPVQKAMELLPLGPVLIIDTPGIDDEGSLGEKRVRQARKVLNRTDVAVLVVDALAGMTRIEDELVFLFKTRQTPYVIVYNKSDLLKQSAYGGPADDGHSVYVSALTGYGIEALKEKIARSVRPDGAGRSLISDLVRPGDLVVLVIPIDKAAPKGRLILPQQQVIRDVLESGAASVVVRESELVDTLGSLAAKPALVITDSQAFGKVSADTPEDVPLTSFSILFARYKGDLEQNVLGVRTLEDIRDGGRVLICEGCTHHRQCDDIGTVKLPRWIRDFTGAQPAFEFTSGGDFPDDLSMYDLIVHCGGCMLNEREMKRRLDSASALGVPMTNYGVLIAHAHGILTRALAPLNLEVPLSNTIAEI
ncbi:MAG: [FeFe] hydrogenase H-cluster maturation GTPase HydF [Clostridiales Family XIII bacterium]|jgi:[FeFe] hydrogenase H-cluster maturation GTPase HydF|nr:[FeFe] hydrogenase H-cluster maturation GTPase HydF [Clostridiales Family XIII bacterium]